MPHLISVPPATEIEPVCEVLHGVQVIDPYRWLEDQNSPRTRAWIEEQTRYARSYLDNIPGREKIRKRIGQFLAIETHDSLMKAGDRYFFRKRLAEQEQACIYMRQGPDGVDQLLVDPFELARGIYTAVKLLRVSPDGRLLLYEIKMGGERTGSFAIYDVNARRTLRDQLPRGYLRGFVFAPDGKGFCYVIEALDSKRPSNTAYYHILGRDFDLDDVLFRAPDTEQGRLGLISDRERLGILVYRLGSQTYTDFYLQTFARTETPERVVFGCRDRFVPSLKNRRLFALTDRAAPNSRVVELRLCPDGSREWLNLIPESCGRIRQWLMLDDCIVLSYIFEGQIRVRIFDLEGNQRTELEVSHGETIRLTGSSSDNEEVFLETESFSRPATMARYRIGTGERTVWSEPAFDLKYLAHKQVSFPSKDGTSIPMFLVGRADVLADSRRPTIMTSYGGYGVPMTPQFSVFSSFLMERGCLFALPSIRGGSEFGAAWHDAAKRCRRQTAYDDFLSAAEWLIQTGRTAAGRLAIFGGSNSGLLVGAAMTQRPDLFCAVVCLVPILDMLRYHLFDGANVWRDEFGTSDDPQDFAALIGYSPYHRVRHGINYPATMIVSGDADQNCNPLHARKMVARLQAANHCPVPILLDYSRLRGHSPVLPLNERIEALTDRMAFLCRQLDLPS